MGQPSSRQSTTGTSWPFKSRRLLSPVYQEAVSEIRRFYDSGNLAYADGEYIAHSQGRSTGELAGESSLMPYNSRSPEWNVDLPLESPRSSNRYGYFKSEVATLGVGCGERKR
jgi:hypothetical protein